MPYVPNPSPEAFQATALFLYAVAYRSGRRDYVRVERKGLWELLNSYPAFLAVIGNKLDFFHMIRVLSEQSPEVVHCLAGSGGRQDVNLACVDPGAYGVYGLGVDVFETEETLLRRGLEPHLPLPEAMVVSSHRPRLVPGQAKTCSKCKTSKPITDFNKRGNGTQPFCRDCQKADAKARNGRTKDGKKYEETRTYRDRTVEKPGISFGPPR